MPDHTTERSAPRITAPLFVAALFASASLIFALQPLFARMVTPLLGGSPAVWNTSMVFFQTALLVGYFYAHTLQRLRTLKHQVIVHTGALLVACVVLPLAPTTIFGSPNVQQPTLWLLGVLAVSVGAPYVVASATAPLLQAWYARTGRHDSADPYFLYGASNLGSLLGLLAYPLVVEPLVGVRGQSVGWSFMYVLVAMLVLASGAVAVIASRRAGTRVGTISSATDTAAETTTETPNDTPAETPTETPTSSTAELPRNTGWRERLFWIAAAAVPSSLLIGVTQHILTDIASAPFLWVPPLVLYLLTFVIAFRKGTRPAGRNLLILHAGLVTLVMVLPKSPYISLDVVLRLAALFAAALVCHLALAAARPHASRLTEYYNYVSLGGVLGGASTVLLAPMLFDGVVEFPLALAATMLFRPSHDIEWKRAADVSLLAGAVLVVGFFAGLIPVEPALLGVVGFAVFLNRGRPAATVPIIVMMMVYFDANLTSGEQLLRSRTFFGSYRVVSLQRPLGEANMLLHGSTIHGVQFRDSARATQPLSYYAAGSALHEGVRAALPVERAADAAFIGLGSGAMACVLREGDNATFIEIDPEVAAIARDPRYFTYLDACPRNTRLVLGDGRIEMARLDSASLDVILADAFSSDAIPTHLITREALRVYMRALRPGGLLVLHVSNRHLAIVNEAVRVAAAEGLAARIWRSPALETSDANSFESPSASAVLVARNEADMRALGLGAHWREPPVLAGRAWSDDFVNLLRTMRETPLDSLPTNRIP